MESVILIGAGGHCKVVYDVIKEKYKVVGVTDIDKEKHGKLFYNIKVLGDDGILEELLGQGIKNAIITLGSVGNAEIRKKLYQNAKKLGFNLANAISKYAIISDTISIGDGNAVMEGVIIHGDTIIGNNTILNTACIIEHDCNISHHVHLSPGARLAGGVSIGEGSHIGIGASIIQGVTIGKNCIVGAGAAVIKDIPDNSLCVGVPAKIIKRI